MAFVEISQSIGVFDSIYSDDTNNASLPTNLGDFSRAGITSFRTSQDLVHALKAMSVRGPLTLTNHLDETREIGRGAQFVMYHNSVSGSGDNARWDIHDVAVKKCHFTLQPGQRLNLASPALQHQVHEMYLEVLALQNERLKDHRNIVNLLGWALEEVYDAMPLLVMDLANCHLGQYLKDEPQISWEIKHTFCLDISSGIDALHDNGIVHGDVKPQNILICNNRPGSRIPLIAKLADFGFSTLEAQVMRGDLMPVAGMSVGWCAPEIEIAFNAHAQLSSHVYSLADNYSAGLVFWSLNCFGGAPPPPISGDDELFSRLEVLQQTFDMPLILHRALILALKKLLRAKTSDRPAKIEELFHNESEACVSWFEDAKLVEPEDHLQVHLGDKEDWELPDITNYALEGLLRSYQEYGPIMTGGELYALFMARSYATISRPAVSIESPHLSALLSSAQKGFLPAQAATNRILASYGIPWPQEHPQSIRIAWLQQAASYGCLMACSDLVGLEPSLAARSLAAFRSQGAYQLMYEDESTRVEWKTEIDNLSSIPVELPDIGALAIGERSVKNRPKTNNTEGFSYDLPLDALSPERLLFLACLAGSGDVVKRLCQRGVNASAKFYEGGVTCLHWLFAFPAEEMEATTRLLIKQGCDINAITTARLINYNYPYEWPLGAPLHWAVVSGNIDAVSNILRHGADCCVRNGQDPYRHDENVRYLDRSGEMTEGNFSEPSGPVGGFTPLDLAAARHDWKVIDAIRELAGKKSVICDTDEEGYTPFHRLQHYWIGYSYDQDRFPQRIFKGSHETYFANMIATIESLQALGGDINGLTSFSPNNPRQGDRPGTLTPLMLAVRRVDVCGVRALLHCGADATIRNNLGYNALSQLFEAGDPEVDPKNTGDVIAALLSHGAEAKATGQEYKEFSPLASAIAAHSWQAANLVLAAGASPLETHCSLNSIAWLLVSRNKFTAESCEEQDIAKATILREYVFSKDRHIVDAVITSVDRSGGSLLHYAAVASLPRCVTEILSYGADPNVYRNSKERDLTERSLTEILDDTYYGSPLDLVVVSRYTLMKNMERHSGMTTPEEFAALFREMDVVELALLEGGARYTRPIGCTDGRYYNKS